MSEEKKEEKEAISPKPETPKAEAPKVETPKAETPKAEAPKEEAPKAEEKKTEAAKTEESKRVKPTVCAVCNKPIKKKRYYYRNGKHYCTKRCWKTTVKKEPKEGEKAPAAEQKSE